MLSRTALLAVAVIGLALLCGCSRTLKLQLAPNAPIELRTFDRRTETGGPLTVMLPPGSPPHVELQQWLARNQSGWDQSLSTTPLQGVIARADGVTVHFTGATVFATTADGQFQKDIDEQDYAFLRAPLGI